MVTIIKLNTKRTNHKRNKHSRTKTTPRVQTKQNEITTASSSIVALRVTVDRAKIQKLREWIVKTFTIGGHQ